MSKNTKLCQYFSVPYIGSTGLHIQYNAQWKSLIKEEIKKELHEELKHEIMLEIKDILKNGQIHMDWEHIKLDNNCCK